MCSLLFNEDKKVQRLQPVFCIVCQTSIALCRSIRRRVIGSGGGVGGGHVAVGPDCSPLYRRGCLLTAVTESKTRDHGTARRTKLSPSDAVSA